MQCCVRYNITYKYVYIHTYTCIYTHIHMYLCIYIYTHCFTDIYIYIYIYITHIQYNIYIYTYTQYIIYAYTQYMIYAYCIRIFKTIYRYVWVALRKTGAFWWIPGILQVSWWKEGNSVKGIGTSRLKTGPLTRALFNPKID